MHIILTHEQADFDALASLLGAYLLDDSALPVLPRRMNRNVSAFLTLYGSDLPFVDPRDMPPGAIEAVTLVDTQSMVTIRGVSSKTRVRVIDHHPMKDNLPSRWEITNDEVGATTTLLIDELRERDGNLNTIQSTLLLMGIYEDTGSLTYTRTTSRDLRAAAYLLEQGANLRIAVNFLNHPLSHAQQVLYDHLRASAEHYHIHGHTILVACGNAQEMDEELSTIAHKLRDLLDPDALFLLIQTRSGVQLIARSTSDQIDVGEVSAHFGGGGHERAAASLIRGRDLDNVRAELVQLLSEKVRPAVTVAEIMSHGLQVLSPTTPVEEAAQRMRRYGYEGYPVVREGQVIGLLTRRAVDRALAHKLNLTAASLMEAGQYTVQPHDSIEHLQRIMTDSGWGQIPVVQPDTNQIIGIVTRTDLLKTLTPQPRLAGRLNLAERLASVMPADRLALLNQIARQAHEQHAALYVVGGFVRDLLLDHPSQDFDLVVEGDAIALARALAAKYGGRVTSHARFGTAKWYLHQADFNASETPAAGLTAAASLETTSANSNPLPPFIDLVTARTEFYTHPTALPTVERGSIKLDLHRRDFTINTLAVRLDGRFYGDLLDYWGGLDDLRHSQVRVLHSLSFIDDPTRMLRAARFEQRFGFQIESRTQELLKEAIPLLDRVSGDRIRHEMNHILSEPLVSQIMTRLQELSLLAAIHPALVWDHWLESRFNSLQRAPDPAWGLNAEDPKLLKLELAYVTWLLRLLRQEAAPACLRLKLPMNLHHAVLSACDLWHDLVHVADSSPSAVAERLENVPALARYAVYLATSDIHLRKALQTYVTLWQNITPTINGHHLRQRGIPPGPEYRRILNSLRNAWLDGNIHSQEEETQLLERLISQI